jgi:hypothetical protein
VIEKAKANPKLPLTLASDLNLILKSLEAEPDYFSVWSDETLSDHCTVGLMGLPDQQKRAESVNNQKPGHKLIYERRKPHNKL